MRRSIVLLSMFFLAMMAATASSVIAADSVSSVNIAEKRAELTASAGIEKIRYFTLDSPKRLVVDLYGVQPGEHSRAITLSDGFTSLRVGPYEDKTRFVFDVSGALFPTFKVNTENEQVVVTWQEARSAARQAQAEAPTVGSAQVTAIDFSTAGGKSTLLIDLKGEATASDPVLDGNRVQFAIKNATLPRALRRVFDTLAFPSAIHSVTPYLVNVAGQPEVRFNVLLKGKTPYQLQKSADGYTFSVEDGAYATSFAAATGVMPLAVDPSSLQAARVDDVAAVETVPAAPRSLALPIIETVAADESKYSGEKTSLVFDNADVRDILRLIAEISDLNIIASDDVKGNVTLRLIDVPWDQALDLILDITGLGMLQEGNVVQILPKNKIRAMKETELTAARSQEKLEPLVTEVVTVSYADLGSVAGPAEEVLSERGSITEDSRNKLLIITDVPSRIEKAKELIDILDTPERQVMIEARIVQVNSNYSRDLGVNWFVDARGTSKYGDGIMGGGGGFLVDVTDEALGSLIATPGLATQLTVGTAVIDDFILSAQLSALESNGNGKVISTPRVTTLNGEKATISQGTSIPYQTSGADGPKTEFVNAELKLEVTPVINPDNSIILEILATNDSPSLTAGATAPSIDTKKTETKVLVRDGETTVIGGIFIENIQESEDGIPGLMHIPILGHLFKSSKKQTVKDELLIFITPRILDVE